MLLSISVVSADNKLGLFYIHANLPENQINKDLSYFDLKMKPLQKQSISVSVYNNTNDEIAVSVSAITASTNSNGIIDYSKEPAPDQSQRYVFSDFVKSRDSVIVVPPSGKTDAWFDIQMPKDDYDGALLGGITFTEIKKKESDKDDPKGVKIENLIAYTVAVKLTENDREIQPELIFEDAAYKSVNYRPVFVNSIDNIKPLIMEKMKMKVTIRNLDKDIVVANRNYDGISMAPNSLMPFEVQASQDTDVAPGEYLSQIEFINGDETIFLEKKFTVTNNNILEAEKTTAQTTLPLWLALVLFIILVLILIIITLLIRIKKFKTGMADEKK